MTTLRTAPEPSEALRLRVAAEVRAWMGRRGVKQIQLAQVLGLSQGSISAKVNGKTPFDLDEIEHLAAFFGIAPGRLMGEETGGGPPPPGPAVTPKSLPRQSRRVVHFASKRDERERCLVRDEGEQDAA